MVLSIVESLGKLRPQPATVIQVRFELTSHLDAVYGKDIIAYQRLGYDSLTWYTGLPVWQGLSKPIVVCTNEKACSLNSVITAVTCSSIGPYHKQFGLVVNNGLRREVGVSLWAPWGWGWEWWGWQWLWWQWWGWRRRWVVRAVSGHASTNLQKAATNKNKANF